MLVKSLPSNRKPYHTINKASGPKGSVHIEDRIFKMTLSPKGQSPLTGIHFTIGFLAGFLGGYLLLRSILYLELIWLFGGIILFSISGYFLSKVFNSLCNNQTLRLENNTLILEKDHWLKPISYQLPIDTIEGIRINEAVLNKSSGAPVPIIELGGCCLGFFESIESQEAEKVVKCLNDWIHIQKNQLYYF